MVKHTNKRIMITLPKKQVEWLYTYTESKGITPSTFIKWLLVKRVDELYTMIQAEQDEEILREQIKIAKHRWIDEEEEQ